MTGSVREKVPVHAAAALHERSGLLSTNRVPPPGGSGGIAGRMLLLLTLSAGCIALGAFLATTSAHHYLNDEPSLLDDPLPQPPPRVIQTVRDTPGDRLREYTLNDDDDGDGRSSGSTARLKISDPPASGEGEILGFGGAFTEAAALTFQRLPLAVQGRVVEMYWGESGIGHTIGRVHINSCDFSVAQYSFDDVENDYSLEHFDDSVQHDQQAMLPFIKRAMAAHAKTSSSSSQFRLFASPWSPPAWMKLPTMTTPDGSGGELSSSRSMSGSALPVGLDPVAADAWARFISRFVAAYDAQGAPLWGITVQNEPEFPAPWEACAFTAEAERDFIRDHLGPVLRAEHPDLVIMAFDHNRDHLEHWAETVTDGDTAEFVDGVAFHWYAGGAERKLDGTLFHGAVRRASDVLAKAKRPTFLLASEACSCPGVELGSWFRAERLAHDLMADLNAGATGWTDWNLLLDSTGGPNHLGNNCDAPILALEDFSDITVQPSYYYLGQISKFVPQGSRRVEVALSAHTSAADSAAGSSDLLAGLDATLRPCDDGHDTRQRWRLASAGGEGSKLVIVEDTCSGSGCGGDGDDVSGLCLAARPDDAVQPQPSTAQVAACSFASADGTPGTQWRLSDDDDDDDGGGGGGGGRISPADNDAQCLRALPRSGEVELADDCGDRSEERWSYDAESATISNEATGLCLTAGWPRLQSVAFVTPRQEIVVIVLNEADHGYEIEIENSGGTTVRATIPNHAMQTYIF